ncbi:hypothetical protein CI1B_20190 [Bradyrhizobium ivorense]|uniref:Uncharacterized protein n=1 Tax=Bradyrhizobium ivorense TaxID=2511166 RepID=A0A508SYL7_9BRAD|nr:hypothetical protein CI1B_20190 [Bradyrhizobium ivorense]
MKPSLAVAEVEGSVAAVDFTAVVCVPVASTAAGCELPTFAVADTEWRAAAMVLPAAAMDIDRYRVAPSRERQFDEGPTGMPLIAGLTEERRMVWVPQL